MKTETKEKVKTKEKEKVIRFLVAFFISTLGGVIAVGIVWLFPKHVVYYTELPVHIQMKFNKGVTGDTILKPLEKGEIQGRLIIITNGLLGEPAKVGVQRKDDFNIESIYLGSKVFPKEMLLYPPKIVFWNKHFAIEEIIIANGDQVSLFLATRNPKKAVQVCQETEVITKSLTVDSGLLMAYLPIFVMGAFIFLFCLCMGILVFFVVKM